MDDFIFGTLATDEQRVAHTRARLSGVTHDYARSPRDPNPDQAVTLDLTVGPAHACDHAWVYWTDDGSDPHGARGVAQNGFATRMQFVGAEWSTLVWGYVRVFRATLPGQAADTIVRYRLSAGAANGDEVLADGGAYFAYYVSDDPPPEWARDAIIYHVFVDRFSPGAGRAWQQPATPSGFYGGTLRGVTEKLDYIFNLGANTLWLSPIFPSPSHHGYDATDLFDIEPRLGTKQGLRELLDAAHARGLRVLLDLVPNHWSDQHANFQQALADAASPYRNWYNFHNYPDEYESFFGVRTLPQINLRHADARGHMLDASAYWLEFGVDGYRLDYASGPTPDFWAEFRRVTRAVKADCWTFGEVVDPPDLQLSFEGLLDGCLDFMLLDAIRQTFAFGRWDALRFAAFLDAHEAYFPPAFSRPSFLDNHDMNRFSWTVRGDIGSLKLAALCQFTLAGAPIIYYGTEVGLSQERDVRQGTRGVPEESRLPMLWGSEQDTQLLEFYRQLIALRNQNACLRRGARRTIHVDAQTFVYQRALGAEELLIALNLASEARQLNLPRSWDSIAFAMDRDCQLRVEGGDTGIELPPVAGAVVKRSMGGA